MEENVQELLLNYIFMEGNYSLDDYPQNIEIINSIEDSFLYQLKDPRLLLLSEKTTREEISRYQHKLSVLRGKLLNDGTVSILKDYNSLQEERLNKKLLMQTHFPDYPYLDENASILGYYDFTVEGMQQIYTLLDNQSQDYFIGFTYDKDEPKAKEKRTITVQYLKRLEEDTDYLYKASHDTYNNHELYLLRKQPKVKVKTLVRTR